MKQNLLVLSGAVIGGAIGYFGFQWIARQGFYGLILPGALLGVGASLSWNRSVPLCAVCGVLALALGFFAEWRFAPFLADGSLGYFVSHLHQLRPITLIMIAVGGLIGFWAPYQHRQMPPGPGTVEGVHPKQ